jgi:carbon monoxide dehydrogenase subunit G
MAQSVSVLRTRRGQPVVSRVCRKLALVERDLFIPNDSGSPGHTRSILNRKEGHLFLRIVLIIGVVIAAGLVFAATKPNTLRITRSTVIKAPPETIFALINDFHNWVRWAPQDKEDRTMVRTYTGPTSGVGAISAWESRGRAGKGRMSIAESVAPTNVSVNVDFVKPFEAHNVNQFTLEPAGTSTKLTWAMDGTNVYLAKVMSVFVNMDRVMGTHFEAGLDNIRVIAEK